MLLFSHMYLSHFLQNDYFLFKGNMDKIFCSKDDEYPYTKPILLQVRNGCQCKKLLLLKHGTLEVDRYP